MTLDVQALGRALTNVIPPQGERIGGWYAADVAREYEKEAAALATPVSENRLPPDRADPIRQVTTDSNPLATPDRADHERRAEGHACDWPGCTGQCHTGYTCPCHPPDPDAYLDTVFTFVSPEAEWWSAALARRPMSIDDLPPGYRIVSPEDWAQIQKRLAALTPSPASEAEEES